jgi:hypothetical protein
MYLAELLGVCSKDLLLVVLGAVRRQHDPRRRLKVRDGVLLCRRQELRAAKGVSLSCHARAGQAAVHSA